MSVAEKFDTSWLDELRNIDPDAFHYSSYLIRGNELKERYQCQSIKCLYDKKEAGRKFGKGETSEAQAQPNNLTFIFCYACNEIGHAPCMVNDDPVGGDLDTPWMCASCLGDPKRDAAIRFYDSDEWKQAVFERANRFRKDRSKKIKSIHIDETSVEAPVSGDMYKSVCDKLQQEINARTAMEVKLRQMEEELIQMRSEREKRKSHVRFDRSEFTSSSPKRGRIDENLFDEYLSNSKEKSKSSHQSEYNAPLHKDFFETATKAPLPNKRKSLLDDVNVSELTLSEKVAIEKMQLSAESMQAQVMMSKAVGLEAIRKALPKIAKFNGDVTKWLQFKQDVERYRSVGQYDDLSLRLHIRNALEGTALLRVRSLIDTKPASEIMYLLQKNFGDPEKVMDQASEELLSIRVGRILFREDVIVINTKIQGYFEACKNAKQSYASSTLLGKHIFDQLNFNHKMLYRSWTRARSADGVNIVNLESLYAYFEEVYDELESKGTHFRKDNRQMMNVSATATSAQVANTPRAQGPWSRNEMYEIKDQNHSQFGYDMSQLGAIAKRCLFCDNSNHHSVQCKRFSSMDSKQKLKAIAEKRLCRCCVVATDHRANDCHVRNGCGFKFNGQVCGLKHHISLHRAFNSSNSYNNGSQNNRSNRRGTDYNSRRADRVAAQTHAISEQQEDSSVDVEQIIRDAPRARQAPSNQTGGKGGFVNPNISKKVDNPYQANVIAVGEPMHQEPVCVRDSYVDARLTVPIATREVQRTVKVFKNLFLGEDKVLTGYSVGDSAAEVSLVRDDVRKQLKIKGERCSLTMQYADGSVRTIPAKRISLKLQGVQPSAKVITLNNVYSIAELNLPSRSLDFDSLKSQFPYLRRVKFESYHEITPLLLIGSPHASVFESRRRLYEGGEGQPVGLLAKLGWCVYGGCPEASHDQYSVQLIRREDGEEVIDDGESTRMTNEELSEMLCYSNSIDSLGIKAVDTHATENEQKAIDIIEEEISVRDDGFIELPLIWNREDKRIPSVPNNFAMVYKRQAAHETKLLKTPQHYEAFNANFVDLIRDGYVRPANDNDFNQEWPNIQYLPMSLVINKNKEPIKYRNVFDASARYMGISLNDKLLKGPDLLIDQIKPLLQMRANRVAFTADVKAMFMRMKITLRDQQCQRVLWRPSPKDDMRIFIVTSMLFGPTCSPFASQYVKNVTADQWAPRYGEAAKLVKENVYMDDLLASIANINTAAQIARQCIDIFGSINLELISFQSNNSEFLKALPSKNVKAEAINSLENENLSSTTKVLGCQWDTKNDCYIYKFDKNIFLKIVKECNHRPTKRDQCCSLARIYDVFGFLVPHTIRGKILLQRSWLAGIDWDEQISDEDFALWKEWVSDIENVAKIKVRRQYRQDASLSELGEAELHTFSDAGKEAFAAVSYIVTSRNGVRSSNIVMARAKVTPIRFKSKTQISQMPRLETCGCLIAARLADTITKYHPEVKFKRYLWTDSLVALRWITNPNHKLPKYAISPIEEILDKTCRNEWRYVPSRVNVADKATKFMKIDFSDSNAVWFTGPRFLEKEEKFWPTEKDAPRADKVACEKEQEQLAVPIVISNVNYKVQGVSSHVLPTEESLAKDFMLDDLSASIKSRYWKLVRATARALKLYLDFFIPLYEVNKHRDAKAIAEKRANNNLYQLTPKDLERAEHFLIRKAQRESYADEYERLLMQKPLKSTELRMLNVFLDEEGIMRINSRIENSNYPQRFALLVPRRSSFTKLLLEQVHYDFRHIHLETQMAYVRSKYWVPQLRAALKSTQANCNFCSLQRVKPYAPLMAPLPEYRTDATRPPFETVGMDCLGPITVRNRGSPKKFYVLIFVCTLTRFIHLALLDSLESIKVTEALVTFWAAHGPSKRIITDRGTNFIGAARVLKEDQQKTLEFFKKYHAESAEKLAEKYNVEWQMIPAHSPWMGGLYERLIKEVKKSIASVLENRRTNRVELNIALQDAAHRINCRPLTHNPVSSEDEPCLTPHDLAKGRSGFPYLPGMPDGELHQHSRDVDYYHRGRLIADDIIRRFTTSYLPMLTKRTKWFDEYRTPIRVDDLVLLIEPNDTRKQWRRARVINLYKGRDGRQRVADVILPDGTIRKARSIQRLAKIEIKSPEECKTIPDTPHAQTPTQSQ